MLSKINAMSNRHQNSNFLEQARSPSLSVSAPGLPFVRSDILFDLWRHLTFPLRFISTLFRMISLTSSFQIATLSSVNPAHCVHSLDDKLNQVGWWHPAETHQTDIDLF
jgi:hypothetical protein